MTMPGNDDDAPWEALQEEETDVRARRGSGRYTRGGTALELLVDMARADTREQAVSLAATLAALDEETEAYGPLVDALLERAGALETQRRLAGSDGLTGIANRRGFDEVLAREVSRCRRTARPLSLLLLDLDGLKRINDERGHQAGDAAIVAVSRACQESLRESDMVARIGGDEFGIVLPETTAEQAELVQRRIRRKLAMESASRDELGVSIGAAVMYDPAMEAHALVERADRALYQNKRKRHSERP